MRAESSRNQAGGDVSRVWSFEEILLKISATLASATPGPASDEIERYLRCIVLMLAMDRARVGLVGPFDGLGCRVDEWTRERIAHRPRAMNANEILQWLTRRIVVDTDILSKLHYAQDETSEDLECARRVGRRLNLAVPVRVGGAVLGAVAFDTVTHVRQRPQRTVQRVHLLTESFGDAFERERTVCDVPLAQEVCASSRATDMAELTASIAHELNQPLGAILSNAQAARRFLAAKKPDIKEARAAIDDIIHDNLRAVEILRSVPALFRRDQAQMSPLDLRAVLLDAERVLSREARGKGISIRSNLQSPLPTIVGNRTQLIEVLKNLASNAFDSICEDERAARVVELLAHSDAQHVRVSVRDFGKGIDPEIMPRLFDAFFTTKINGMGIGLRIARSIIENHGGRLWAVPNPERGATLVFELPVKPDAQGEK